MGRPKKLSDDECLERAFEVISREGFESFTLAQVSKAVGLSPAALIKRFRTKERLARAARDRKWDVNFEQTVPRPPQSKSPSQPASRSQLPSASASQSPPQLRGLPALFHFVKLIARSVDSKRLGEHMRLLGSQADEPRSRKKVAAYFQGTRDRLASSLREAHEDGEIRLANAERVAATLEALIQGAIFQFGFLESRGIEAHLREHVQTFLEPYRAM